MELNELFKLSDIIGYIGVIFLIIRFIPPIISEIKNIRNTTFKTLDVWFIGLETMASIFLLTSAIIFNVYPFIIANGCSILFYIIILCIQCIKRIKF